MGFDFPLSACRPAKAKLPPHRWAVMLAWLLALLAAQASASSDKTAGAAPSPSAQTAALTADLEAARQTLSRLQNDLAEAVKQAEVNKADNLADLQQRQQLAERFIFHASTRGALDASTGPSSQLLAAYRALIDQYALIERSIEAQKRAELTRTDSKMYYEMRVRSALPPKALKAYGLMELARQVRDQGQFAKGLTLWEQAETLVKESFNEHIAAMAKWREDALKEAAKEREKSRVKVEAWLKSTMQSIPAGEFLMGSEQDSSDETPVHKVHVAAFSLSKTEVTFELYDLCVASSSCY
ncbi:MAG TPA: SUMF1/EgtB/PvdO family nonheme iron enzyme, partial [Cellvibrionaceae bacterium]|nr:SUMF1/EgtB/PvdO family nonheme iron enzyme [Cellvibrionaceae bacterium]